MQPRIICARVQSLSVNRCAFLVSCRPMHQRRRECRVAWGAQCRTARARPRHGVAEVPVVFGAVSVDAWLALSRTIHRVLIVFICAYFGCFLQTSRLCTCCVFFPSESAFDIMKSGGGVLCMSALQVVTALCLLGIYEGYKVLIACLLQLWCCCACACAPQDSRQGAFADSLPERSDRTNG